jgi:hypothetical protein
MGFGPLWAEANLRRFQGSYCLSTSPSSVPPYVRGFQIAVGVCVVAAWIVGVYFIYVNVLPVMINFGSQFG